MVARWITYLFLSLPILSFGQLKYEVEKVSVPVSGDVYAPVIFNDQLVFCGNRKDKITYTVVDKYGNEPINIYITDTINPSKANAFAPELKTDFHDGPISFDASKKRCVISRNLLTEKKYKAFKSETNLLGLYEYTLQNGVWTILAPLEFNDPSYNCTHPALSSDGKTLIFSSNMPGGRGGYDLWKVVKINGTWSKPENLGIDVNTSGNEFFPTFVGNEIYFSSNRKAIGGMDLYHIVYAAESVTCELLAEPLNSTADDFGLTSINDLTSGYFSTNRSGSDEIWSFELNYPTFNGCDSLVEDDFCYTLIEENAHSIGSVESLVYEWDINGVKLQGIEVDYCFPTPGDYEISVDIIDTIIRKVYAKQAYYFLTIAYEEQPYINAPDTIRPGQLFTLNPDSTNLPGAIIDQYYWFISDGKKVNGETASHAFKEVGDYQITLGVIGTKDGEPFQDCTYRGIVCTTDEFEEEKRRKRLALADLAVDVQIKESEEALKNSDTTVVVHSIQIAESDVPLSVTDKQLAHVADDFEIKQIYSEEDSTYRYYIGEWPTLVEAHDTWKEIIPLHPDATIISQRIREIKGIPINEIFSLKNIQFDVNKWDIRSEAANELKVIFEALQKHQTLKLKISAHTDNVGSLEDNKVLSLKRGKAILEYLVNAGISADRMMSDGFGEEQPIDTNETPEGRQNNRRVEFKLITGDF